MARLGIITTSFPDRIAGQEAAGSFVADFAGTLTKYVDVTVLAPGRENAHITDNKLTITKFAVPRLPLSLLTPANIGHWPSICKTLHAGSKSVRAEASAQFDHVLACWVLPCGYWAGQIKQRFGVPYSCWALGSDIWSLSHIPIVQNILKSTLEKAHTCFADGYQLKEEVEILAGKTCQFLPSTRRLPGRKAKQLATEPPYRLAFLGRWHHNKGIDLLLEALAQLPATEWAGIKEVRICGGGPLEGKVTAACHEMHARGLPVSREAYLDKEGAAALLYDTDYLIIPSRLESIPVIFSDALQAGCPVIATPVGDLPRLFQQHRVGILAAAATAGHIKNAISQALATPPAQFRETLQSSRELFDLDQAAQKLLGALGLC